MTSAEEPRTTEPAPLVITPTPESIRALNEGAVRFVRMLNPDPGLIAVCTPNSHPHEDGHVEHGYQINVLDDELTVLATIDLPDWDTFRPASAGHRLIEAGYMISPEVDRADLNGWTPTANGYTVPVVRLDPDSREAEAADRG